MRTFSSILFFFIPFFLFAQADAAALDFESLQQKIAFILQQRNVPGAQAAVVNRDTALWLGNFGYADWEAKRPVTNETLFRIGSVTKSFIAVSAMMLVEEGRLNLEDKARDLAPELPFKNRWEESDPIRLFHLMEHTAGFDDMHMAEYATNGEGWTTLEGLQFHPDSKTSRWKPGKYNSYCNSGPPMVAYIIEKKTGKTIEDFISERILQPLDMPHSSLLKTTTVDQRLSKGYVGAENAEAPYWHIVNRAAGAMNSNAGEMANYVRFFLNDGALNGRQFLSPGSIQRIETPTSTLAARAGVTEGYGLYIYTDVYKGVRLYGHGGAVAGFLTIMNYIPELDLGYIFFINKSDGGAMSAINQTILDLLVPERKTPEQTEKTTIDAPLAGYYRTATSRNQLFRFLEWPNNVLRITEKDGALYLQALLGSAKSILQDESKATAPNKLRPLSAASAMIAAPEAQKLEPFRKNIYRYEGTDHFSSPVVFVEEEGGRLILQIPNKSANFYKTSARAVWGPIAFFALWPLLAISSFVVTFIWLAMWLFGGVKIRYKRVRIWALLAALSYFWFSAALAVGLSGDVIQQLGRLTRASFFIFLSSSIFGFCSLAAIWTSLKSFNVDMHSIARIYFFLISLSSFIMALYFGYWGILGVRTWLF